MKEFVVKYWIERNDIATDVEKDIIAIDCEDAERIFKEITSPYKRIESITEKDER